MLTEPLITNTVTGNCLLLLQKFYGYFQGEETALSLAGPGSFPVLLADEDFVL